MFLGLSSAYTTINSLLYMSWTFSKVFSFPRASMPALIPAIQALSFITGMMRDVSIWQSTIVRVSKSPATYFWMTSALCSGADL